MMELCWRASLMCRAPSSPILLYCINESMNQSINQSINEEENESEWEWLVVDEWLSDWSSDSMRSTSNQSSNQTLSKSPPRILNNERHVLQGWWRWWWSCVEEHRWCIVLLLLQSCCPVSMNQSINQWVNEEQENESGWWLMSDWVIDRATQWDRHQINHQIKLSPKNPKNPQYERRT